MSNNRSRIILTLLLSALGLAANAVVDSQHSLASQTSANKAKREVDLFVPDGNGLFILYYGGSLEPGTKKPTEETLEAMKRLWKLQPNFVVVGDSFDETREIVDVFHKSEGDLRPVRVLAYVMMTEDDPATPDPEDCTLRRSAAAVDSESRLAMNAGYDGIFFDCAPQDPTQYPQVHDWNMARVTVVKSYGDRLVVMNPGVELVDSSMFEYADIVSVENRYDKKPTAFRREADMDPEKSEKVEICDWRWLSVQGDPQKKAAHNAAEALERLKIFRENGGFWYYSPPHKSGKGATHVELATWLEDFGNRVKRLEACPCVKSVRQIDKRKVVEANGVYHGAFPEFGESEDNVTASAIRDFESATGKNIAWAYFSNNWFLMDQNDEPQPLIRFPNEAVLTIWNHRKLNRIVPFIRMMPRSSWKKDDSYYSLQKIIDGKFDQDLRQWARAARDIRSDGDLHTRIPLMVEFGTEANGNWFPWSAKYNGGSKATNYGDPTKADGPERYRDAYRHIIELFRCEGVTNITWVFHVDAHPAPPLSWNNLAAYYPGDSYIDWTGASVYGPATPDDPMRTFEESFTTNDIYKELCSLSNKPIAVLEFGVDDRPSKAQWISEALDSIAHHFTRIKAISYWHSSHRENGYHTRFRLADDSLEAYKNKIKDPFFLSEVVLH